MSNLDTLAPGETWRDDQVTGLTLRNRGRHKSWHLYYRTKMGQERRPKIGEYPTVSLRAAREIAKAMLAEVWAGKDPSLERKLGRVPSDTMSDLCDLYLMRHALKKKSGVNDRRIIEAYIRPLMGRYQLGEIGTRQISVLHQRVSQTAPIQANRVVTLLSTMFTLAERWGLRPGHTNPCTLVMRNRELRRRRYMTPDEAVRITEVLAKHEADQRLAVATIRLLLLTGARRGEICGRTLPRVGNELCFADSKTGAKTVHLPDVAVELIEREKLDGVRLPRTDYISRFWRKVRAEAGVGDLRLHDLRHSFASVALSAGIGLGQIGELLGHSSAQTTKRYAHLQTGAAKVAVNSIGNALAGMIGVGRIVPVGQAAVVGADAEIDLHG